MAVRSWDELRLLRLARRVFTVVKKKKHTHTCTRTHPKQVVTDHTLTTDIQRSTWPPLYFTVFFLSALSFYVLLAGVALQDDSLRSFSYLLLPGGC